MEVDKQIGECVMKIRLVCFGHEKLKGVVENLKHEQNMFLKAPQLYAVCGDCAEVLLALKNEITEFLNLIKKFR